MGTRELLKNIIPLWKKPIPKYPVYWKGNPQLRVFLPLFWMKMVKTEQVSPRNHVRFITHPQMTKMDVQQYLEKIYKVKVNEVRLMNKAGKTRKHPGTGHLLPPEDDQKIAIVQLDEAFDFPDIFKDKPTDEKKNAEDFKRVQKEFQKEQQDKWDKKDIPSFFH